MDNKIKPSIGITSLIVVIALVVTTVLAGALVPGQVYAETGAASQTAEQALLYKVTFSANGGKVSKSYKWVQYPSVYGALPKPTRSGYVFRGWYTKKSGGSKITQYSGFLTKGNKTLYARWQKTGSYEYSVMTYINNYRKKSRLVRFTWDKKLYRATKVRAVEITKKFSHTRPNRTSGARYLLRYVKKGRSAGECLGKGFDEPSKLAAAFMKSPSHKRILMMKKGRTCAVSCRAKGNVMYWCVGTSNLYR